MRPSSWLKPLSVLVLFALCALSGQSQDKVAPKIVKEIQDLEQRLQKLQGQLKAIQEGKAEPAAKPVPITENLDKLLAWRPIGPANMGGRITGIAVVETDPSCYYVATASGGL